MRPQIHLLSPELLQKILEEAFGLLESPGIRLGTPDIEDLLRTAGARIENGIAHIPRQLAQACVCSVPREFYLYNRQGEAVVRYGGDHVHFDPGSSCVQVLDAETLEARASVEDDLVHIVQVAEMLPQFAAQSTAVVCNDAPSEIGDLYRLYVVLKNSNKPVVTGAFSSAGLGPMLELLALDSGGREQLRRKPRAIFDVCPSPPLNWSEFGAHNLVELARAGVPAEIVSMPLAGGAAPVTLAGSITQHAAECIAGIVIHQLASAGAPIVWGGAPAIFDMRYGNTPMGAIETAMLNMGCAEIGKSLGLPTHGYLVATDSKLVDYQAGAESARSALLGALSGINMISGAGMIDSLACFSVEKLVIDAESIGSAQRLLAGVGQRGDTLAAGMFAQLGHSGEFLKLKETRLWFREEQYVPSDVMDRESRGEKGVTDTFDRARERVSELLSRYETPVLGEERLNGFEQLIERERSKVGV